MTVELTKEAQEKWKEWFSIDDAKQVAWGENYVLKRRDVRDLFIENGGMLTSFFAQLSVRNPDKALRLLERMKAAWGRVADRDGSKGTKQYNFTMSTSIQPKLRQLAKENRTPIYKLLEVMISDNEQYRQERVAEQKAALKQQKETLAAQSQKVEGRWKLKLLGKEQKLVQLQKVIELQREALAKIALAKHKSDQLLKHSEFNDPAMLTDDELMVAKRDADQYLRGVESEAKRIPKPIEPRAYGLDVSSVGEDKD